MSEVEHEREASNQTATFAKIIDPHQLASSQALSSIPEEPADLTHLEASLTMPQPLIKSKGETNEHEFTSRQGKGQGEQKKEQAPNITFYPRFADQLLYEEKDLEQLRVQQGKLKGELSGLNEMISDLIDKKNNIMNEYEQVVRDKRAYKRLMKNLEQEYEGYLFMLDGDYCQRLTEESQKQKQLLLQLKHQVHALNLDLSRPLISNADDNALRLEQLEKQCYQMQINQEKLQSSNKRKMERLAQLLEKNAQKQKDIKQISKKIDKCEYERELEDEDPEEMKKNNEQYEQLSKKLEKLKKIKEVNEKVKEMEYNRRVKEIKEKQVSNGALDLKIEQFNEKLYSVLVELENMKQQPSSTTKDHSRPAIKLDPLPKRSSSAFKEVSQLFLSQKNNVTLQPETPANNKKSSKSLARVKTEPVEIFDDRQQLLMRKKKIYTQLQRNMYFKNIENREEEKLSRIQEFDNKANIAISSYDRFHHHPLHLPEIDPRPQNPSIIYAYESAPQRRLNRKAVELHSKQFKASKYHPNSSNYRELCARLNRDRLLIEEDCEYDMGQLIYNGQA